MHVVSDDERREVAQNMRDGVKSKTEFELLSLNGSSSAIRWLISYVVFGDKKYHSGVDLMNRLADLIEPSCDREAERTCRDTDCDTESITCSECGEITRYTLFWVDVDGGKTVKGHRPRFCSNCGRRVLYDSNDYI